MKTTIRVSVFLCAMVSAGFLLLGCGKPKPAPVGSAGGSSPFRGDSHPMAAGKVYSGTDGVAIMMILDTSGSMRNAPVEGDDRRRKIEIAREAALGVLDDLKDFKNLNFGLLVFEGEKTVREVRPLVEFDHESLRRYVAGLNEPSGNTPIGEALVMARGNLARMPAGQSLNILLITDGENTSGRAPETVVPLLQGERAPGLYIVGFDLNPGQASTFGVLRERAGARYYEARKGEDLRLALAEVFFGQGGILAEIE